MYSRFGSAIPVFLELNGKRSLHHGAALRNKPTAVTQDRPAPVFPDGEPPRRRGNLENESVLGRKEGISVSDRHRLLRTGQSRPPRYPIRPGSDTFAAARESPAR